MKNFLILVKVIKNIVITIILFYLYIHTVNGKIIMLPFLICGVASLLKSISILFYKDKYINFFNKVYILSFLLFWFGMIVYFCYINIINGEYVFLLFSIPFWIVGIYIFRKIRK